MKPAVNEYTINKAGEALGAWLIRRAHKVSRHIGFGYIPANDAPDTFEGIKAEYLECATKRRAFRVWDGGSDSTIYGSAEANYAFRFLHDVSHVETDNGFDYHGEMMTALSMGAHVLRAFGDSLESRVYFADTIGQVEYFKATGGKFPEDQAHFVRFCVDWSQDLPIHQLPAALDYFVGRYLAHERAAAFV